MYKIDLHTHSTASPDGGISSDQYIHAIDHSALDFIAVTDHNTIAMAVELQKMLGKKIIIGEEITTLHGEIIGLFLTETIAPHQTLKDTVAAIKAQGGVVYVPHPFETVRKGINPADLTTITDDIDIVEVYNGRAFVQNKGPEAITWARLRNKACAASSDAHGAKGLGSAYTIIDKEPTAKNLTNLVLHGKRNMERPPLRTLLYPKANRFKRMFQK